MSKVKNLGLDNSLLNEFLGELRNVNIQQDSLRFRKNLERIGSTFAMKLVKRCSTNAGYYNTTWRFDHEYTTRTAYFSYYPSSWIARSPRIINFSTVLKTLSSPLTVNIIKILLSKYNYIT